MQYLENLTNATSLDVIIDITPYSKPKISVLELEFLSLVWGTCNSFAMIFSLKLVWGTCNLLSLKRNTSCKWQFGRNPTTISFNKRVKCVKSKDLIMYLCQQRRLPTKHNYYPVRFSKSILYNENKLLKEYYLHCMPRKLMLTIEMS